MSSTRDTPCRSRTEDREASLQGRIDLMRRLAQVGSPGLTSGEAVEILKARGFNPEAARTLLARTKRKGFIYGKGQYVGKCCVEYRYFSLEAQCHVYEFEPFVRPVSDRNAKKIAYQKARWEALTETEKDAARAARAERERIKNWKRKGFDVAPAKRVYPERGSLTDDEKRELDRVRSKARRDCAREKKLLAGPGSRPARKTAKAGLAGSLQIVRLVGTAAPVRAPRHGLVGEADYSRAKVTIAPVGYDYRYHVPHDHVGEFSQSGIGRYLEESM